MNYLYIFKSHGRGFEKLEIIVIVALIIIDILLYFMIFLIFYMIRKIKLPKKYNLFNWLKSSEMITLD